MIDKLTFSRLPTCPVQNRGDLIPLSSLHNNLSTSVLRVCTGDCVDGLQD